MSKRPRFLDEKKRSEHNAKVKEIEAKLSAYRKVDSHETYNEALQEWLPQGQKVHAKGSSYLFLCSMLKKFLEEKFSEENKQALRLAKENFEHYCETKEAT